MPHNSERKKEIRAKRWILLSGSRATLTTPPVAILHAVYQSIVSKACLEKAGSGYIWMIHSVFEVWTNILYPLAS